MKSNIPSFFAKVPGFLDVLEKSPDVKFADSVEQLVELSFVDKDSDYFEVTYPLPDGTDVLEATVARVRNGVAVNYPEPYMRRRDPDCMVIGDDKPTDKPTYSEKFGQDFSKTRQETFDWLESQPLAVFAFRTGYDKIGEDALAVVPANSAFFALGLAMLQGLIPISSLDDSFDPKSIIYVAPPFRHTHFDGQQIVVHNRMDEMYEIFSYNLYPGPSAKKGVYSTLINNGEQEGWITAHCSAIRAITPYDNIVTFMHEGASGGGKSEMLEQPHRLYDGQMLIGQNLVTKENVYIEIPRTCDILPVCDDMALCHPSIQKDDGKLWLVDGENGWFLRVNHITEYGTDPTLEKLTAQAPKPLFFLNVDAVPNSRALIWEHIEDEPGKPCPNPRVIVPREIYPDVVKNPVGIDYRSFGVRTPPCTKEDPSYGIIGLFHLLPPALAWLWRLVSPRGFSNPSIVDSDVMSSEGVGSYYPFLTGLKVNQANLLLDQIEQNNKTRYTLVPNQHIGAFKTGFMPQWLTRDYLARRGMAPFNAAQITESRCSLLGYAMKSMRIEGHRISHWFLEVHTQPEVGEEGYDKGAEILKEFFDKVLSEYLGQGLSDTGRRIIECCRDGGSVSDYNDFFPDHSSFIQKF